MKKSTLLAASVFFGAISINAQDIVFANPVLEDNSFVVKYDMENHKFAESNDFEIDETFVFAIDVTGTPYETALKEKPRNPAVLGRSMAHDFYVNNDVCGFEHYKNEGNLDGRLFHIEGNIYGAVFNLMQLAQGRFKDGCFGLVNDGVYDATADGVKVVFGANHFGFGWSATNHGEEWWDAIAAPIDNLWFSTAPYTGTKKGADFYFDEYTPGSALEGCEQVYTDKGYARPEAWAAMQAGVREVSIADTDAPVEYFNLQGVRVNEPTAGLYIRRQGRNVSKVIIM